MSVSDAFLSTCRTRIDATSEKSAFQTAFTTFADATHTDRGRYWHEAFGDGQAGLSPAYRLRKAIRDIVTAHNGESDGSYSQLDIEAAVRTLCNQYVPSGQKPLTAHEEEAVIESLLQRKQTS